MKTHQSETRGRKQELNDFRRLSGIDEVFDHSNILVNNLRGTPAVAMIIMIYEICPL
jgi:hypothetical protein